MDFKGMSDSKVLKEILKGFFSKKTIRQTIKFIYNQELAGCEKWLQIELLKYLFDIEQIWDDEIVKEETYKIDSRTSEKRMFQRIDITFRPKNRKYYIALELKFKNYLALKEIENDFNKVSNSLPSEKAYFRKIFALLMHPTQDENVLKQKMLSRGFDGKLEFSKKAPAAKISYTLFSKGL